MSEHALTCDTSILLYLGRIGQLDLLPALFKAVFVPAQVVLELDMGRMLRSDVPPRALGDGEYAHCVIGYNYRMSNVLAAIGRGQLRVLEQRVQRKREIYEAYHRLLGDLPGIGFMPEAPWGRSNRWLTCITVDPAQFGATREDTFNL